MRVAPARWRPPQSEEGGRNPRAATALPAARRACYLFARNVRGMPAMQRAALFILLMLLPCVAHAQKRVALVIGNSAYKHAGSSPTPRTTQPTWRPPQEARLPGHRRLRPRQGRLRPQGPRLSPAPERRRVGVFFYAGHGLQVAGRTTWCRWTPSSPRPPRSSSRWCGSTSCSASMERAENTNVMFLDACRDNPLARNLARAHGHALGRDRARPCRGRVRRRHADQLLDPAGQRGARRNRPQLALCRGAGQAHGGAGDDLSAMLIEVRNDVMQETENKQVPWEHRR